MKKNPNNKIKKEKFALIGDFSRVKVRINNNKNNIINSSCKLLIILIAALLILLLVPSTLALPSTIYGPNGIAIAQVSEDGTLIYAGDGTEFLILNDSNGNIIYKEKISPFGVPIEKQGVNPAPDSYDYDVQVYIPKVADPKDVGKIFDPETGSSPTYSGFHGPFQLMGYVYTVGSFMGAIVDAPGNFVKGTYGILRHPIRTFEGIATQGFLLYYIPKETLSGYGSAIATSYNENPGYFIGERAVDVGLLTWGVWSKVSRTRQAARTGWVGSPTTGGQRVFYVNPEGVARVSEGFSTKPTILISKILADLRRAGLNPRRMLPEGYKYNPWHPEYSITSYIVEEPVKAYRLWGIFTNKEKGSWWWVGDPPITSDRPVLLKEILQPMRASLPPGNYPNLAVTYIPKGTRVQTGIVAPVLDWGGLGGAQQLQILDIEQNLHTINLEGWSRPYSSYYIAYRIKQDMIKRGKW